MEVIQTFPNGTTIEFECDSNGNCVHRICTASGSLCRFAESNHIAISYAQQFEEYYSISVKKEEEEQKDLGEG